MSGSSDGQWSSYSTSGPDWSATVHRPVRPARALSTALIVLATVYTVVTIGAALAAFPAAQTYATTEDALLEFTAYDALGTLSGAVLLAAGIVVLVWTARVRSNAETLNPAFVHRRSRVWAWLGWLVPVVSFWFPYQVVRDVHRSAATAAPLPLAGWWATWIAGQLLTVVASALLGVTEPSAAVEHLGIVAVGVAVTTVIALVLFIRIVRVISAEQQPV